jgi:hypothetical protein
MLTSLSHHSQPWAQKKEKTETKDVIRPIQKKVTSQENELLKKK